MITFGPQVDGYYDVADQLIHDLRLRAEERFRAMARRREEWSASRAAFERHREVMRRRFLTAIGGLPTERTPLHPQVTGRIDRGAFAIEKLIFESLPEFYVTALLYLPRERERRAPAVLFVCGHAGLAKAYPEYQAVCIDLAANGFVVLAIDPPGQGERYQYWDPERGEPLVRPGTTEHTHAGLQFVVQGASLARHFVWDGMRAIDYLCERSDVDPHRIAVTGNSGGGTQTSFLMMADHRLAAAIPCTFIMTLESYLKTGQPQDSEQIVRGGIAGGPDHDDYLTAMAPKPVLVGAVDYDFFPIEGTIEAVERARRVYRLYGAEERIALVRAPARHAYVPALREAAVNWLRVHLQRRQPDFRTGEPETLPPEQLRCTPDGQVLGWKPQARTVWHLARERAARLPEPDRRPDALRAAIRDVLGMPPAAERPPAIYPRVIAEPTVDGYRCEKIFFFSDRDIVVTGVMIHPREGTSPRRTELVLFENGTTDIPQRRAMLEARLGAGSRLFVFDPRGMGAVASRPIHRSDDPHSTEYRLGCDAMMLEISTLGLRLHDVLRAGDYLQTRSDVAGQPLGIVGEGFGGLLALYAAALDSRFATVHVERALASYRDWCDTRLYDRQVASMRALAWGVLARFDLPDLLVAIAPREVTLVAMRAASGETFSAEDYANRFLTPRLPHLPTGWRPVLR